MLLLFKYFNLITYHFTAWFFTSDILSSTSCNTCFRTLFSVVTSPRKLLGSVLISAIKSFRLMYLLINGLTWRKKVDVAFRTHRKSWSGDCIYGPIIITSIQCCTVEYEWKTKHLFDETAHQVTFCHVGQQPTIKKARRWSSLVRHSVVTSVGRPDRGRATTPTPCYAKCLP